MKHPKDELHVTCEDNHYINGAIGALLRIYASTSPRTHVTQTALIRENKIQDFKVALATLARSSQTNFFLLSPELSPLRHSNFISLQIGQPSLIVNEHNLITPQDSPTDAEIKLGYGHHRYR